MNNKKVFYDLKVCQILLPMCFMLILLPSSQDHCGRRVEQSSSGEEEPDADTEGRSGEDGEDDEEVAAQTERQLSGRHAAVPGEARLLLEKG